VSGVARLRGSGRHVRRGRRYLSRARGSRVRLSVAPGPHPVPEHEIFDRFSPPPCESARGARFVTSGSRNRDRAGRGSRRGAARADLMIMRTFNDA
jgi:hypothetical protein